MGKERVNNVRENREQKAKSRMGRGREDGEDEEDSPF